MPSKRQVLRKEVGDFPDAGKMSDRKLPLRDAVDEPVQAHVADFGQLGLDGLVGNADGDLVVAMKERRRLIEDIQDRSGSGVP